ncbi:MAG: hypothetical protein AAGA90_20765 [Actinomycetota bacterium]
MLLVAHTPSLWALGIAYHDGEIGGWCEGDNEVNGTDVQRLLDEWGPCADPDDCPADLNGSGAVGEVDLAILLAHWGPCHVQGDTDGDDSLGLGDLQKVVMDAGLVCRGDLDYNGHIDGRDYALAEREWTRVGDSEDEHPGVPEVDGSPTLGITDMLQVLDDLGTDCRSDVNQDGIVNGLDAACVCIYLGYSEEDCDDLAAGSPAASGSSGNP